VRSITERWLLLLGLALLGVITVGALTTSEPLSQAQATREAAVYASPTYAIPGQVRDLANASAEELSEVALARTLRYVAIVSGQPEVILVRRVSEDELVALGISPTPLVLPVEEPPLALVILRGDFDVRNLASGSQYTAN
jgi:hypothetical protein